MERKHESLDCKLVGTPWGRAQYSCEYGPGLKFFSTSSHGGFCVSPDLMRRMPDHLRKIDPFCGSPGWYEEDCDWALVCLAFPQFFTDHEFYQAVCTAKSRQPQSLTEADKAKAQAWLDANRELWTTGSAGTSATGWWVNAYSLVDPSQSISRTFAGVPTMPSTFTKEEFLTTDWPIYKG